MKVAMLFPGQGSQFVGMGKELYNQYEWVRDLYDVASDICNMDLKKLCFNADLDTLTQTNNAQLAIFLISYINFIYLKRNCSLIPKYMAGHSLGEFTALAAANSISFADTLKIVQKRALLMQIEAECSLSGMLAVRTTLSKAKEVLQIIEDKYQDIQLQISNYNSPKQIVLAGNERELEIAKKVFEQEGFMTTKLAVAAAFHTTYMRRASDEFEEILKKVTFFKPSCNVISNVNGKPYGNNIREVLAKQMTSMVQWYPGISYLDQEGVEIFIDIGPKSTLKKLCKKILRNKKIYSLDEDFKTIVQLKESICAQDA